MSDTLHLFFVGIGIAATGFLLGRLSFSENLEKERINAYLRGFQDHDRLNKIIQEVLNDKRNSTRSTDAATSDTSRNSSRDHKTAIRNSDNISSRPSDTSDSEKISKEMDCDINCGDGGFDLSLQEGKQNS